MTTPASPTLRVRAGVAALIAAAAAAVYVLGFYGRQAPGSVGDRDDVWTPAHALRWHPGPPLNAPEQFEAPAA